MISFWPALPIGILIAAVVSAVGIGGGILWMPFLLLVVKMSPETAVITSLTIQSAGMGSGCLAYKQQKRIDGRLALTMLAVTLPGIGLGALITRQITSQHIELALGLITMGTAFLFVSANQKYDDLGRTKATWGHAKPYLGLIGTMAVASGMLSVSIGEWLVPIMRSKMALRMSIAIATSITTIFGTCLLGVSFHFLLGSRPHWQTIVWAVPGVIIGGQLGPRIAGHINERMLKEVFIFLLTLIGIHLVYNAV